MRPSTHVRKSARRRAARASEKIGVWRLETCIGEGRWTRVYQASPEGSRDHADYAVKVLKPEFRADRTAIGLIKREATLGRDLAHPNLVSVLASHTDAPPYYVVTPYLEGATWRDVLQHRGPLTPPFALWLARQTTEALRAMHGQGWLHADIKPDNIFIAMNGHVTLGDLGLSRRIDTSSMPTADNPLAGTPAYLPPEAFCPEKAFTPASDVYSLGATLYESLTGRLPFPQRDPAELVSAVAKYIGN